MRTVGLAALLGHVTPKEELPEPQYLDWTHGLEKGMKLQIQTSQGKELVRVVDVDKEKHRTEIVRIKEK